MKLQKQQLAKQFIDLVIQGIACWVRAGEIAAKAVEEDPKFIDRVCKSNPDITKETVNRFVLIGQRKLHPQLCLSETPGVKRLRRLPYPVQEKHVVTPVDLVIKDDGKVKVLNVDVRNLTPHQASQVFSADGIRTEAEQRAWLEDKAAKRAVPTVSSDTPWRITRDRELVVSEPCRLSRRDVARILAEMEA